MNGARQVGEEQVKLIEAEGGEAVTTPGRKNASIPVIDLRGESSQIAKEIHQACTQHGFFYISGHGIDRNLQADLESLTREFFARDLRYKSQWSMELAGAAWRGYFPVGGELTSGQPDLKEGLYFGEEHAADHPKRMAAVPMFGANLFPDLPGFSETVLRYMRDLSELSQRVMQHVAMSLGLTSDYFLEHYTKDPFTLFRIFHYPAEEQAPDQAARLWGVGEHTDYGLLTILKQDNKGGLEIKTHSGWLAAPPIADTFVCNIGDMLDRISGGYYRSTPHRVRNISGQSRYSWPFFFDPNFDAKVERLPNHSLAGDDRDSRWDQNSVHEFTGTYGDYILKKVAKVFPTLRSGQ